MQNMTALCRFVMLAVGISNRLFRIGKFPTSSKIFHQSFAAKSFCAAGLLWAAAGAASMPVMAQEAAETPRFDNAAAWNLTSATIVNKGQLDALTEGKFARDFILEAKATATNPAGSLVPAGTFRLVLSAFSPASDQHGRKKDVWYVQGKWTLTDDNAPGAGNSGSRAGVISGQIAAELAFNPVITKENWTAKVRLPITRIAPAAQTGSNQLAKGDGALMVDSKHEGRLSLNLSLRPLVPYQEVQ